MKDNEGLVIGVAALAVYFLTQKKTDTGDSSGTGGLGGFSLNLPSAQLPNINLALPSGGAAMPDLSALLALAAGNGIAGNFDMSGLTGKVDTSLADLEGRVKLALDKLLAETGKPATETPGIPIPTAITDLGKGFLPDADTEGLREKIGVGAGVGGGVGFAWLTKWLPKVGGDIVSRLVPKAAPRVLGLGAKAVPVLGWAYLAADIGATAYELISGKNIAGGWLGWGELIQGEKAGVEANIDHQLAYHEVFKGQSSEAPSAPYDLQAAIQKVQIQSQYTESSLWSSATYKHTGQEDPYTSILHTEQEVGRGGPPVNPLTGEPLRLGE